jgi:hypothetical protein
MPIRRPGTTAAAAAAAAALTLAACSPAGESASESGEGGELSIATGSTGGVYYPLGGGFATMIRKNVQGYDATVQETNASIDNMLLVQQGNADLALGVGDVVSDAIDGVREFKNPLDVCSMGVVYDNFLHAMTTTGTGIKSIDDLRGKVVSIGDPNSATELGALRVLEAAGIDPETDIEMRQLSVDDTVVALKDGTIDAGFWSGGVPTSSVVDLATTGDLELIPNGEYASQLQEKYGPYYVASDIPAGTYEGVDQAVSAIRAPNVLVANTSMDEQLQEDITSAIFDNKQELVQVHPAAKELDASNAELPYLTTCPGAQTYFEQAGS